MKTRSIVPDSDTRKAAGIRRHLSITWRANRPLTPFCILRETLDAIILITDPEKVRETLGLLESEPGIGQATDD
jgi:hypothetical protein